MREASAQRAQRGDSPFARPAVVEIGTGKLAEPAKRPDTEALYYPSVQYVYGEREDPPVMLGGKRPLTELNRAVIGSLVPRALFLEVGGFGEEPIYEDWSLFLRCSKHVPLVPVPEAVYRVHVRPQSRNLDSAFQREWYWRIRNEHEASFAA